MGRELKRVALDFDCPIGKVWAGFLNPHSGGKYECPGKGTTCFNGENAAAVYLSQLSSMFTVVAESAWKGRTHPYLDELPYLPDHPRWEVQPEEVRKKAIDFFLGLTGQKMREHLSFGFTGGRSAFGDLLKAAGINWGEKPEGGDEGDYNWSQCSICRGTTIHPDHLKEYEEWEPTEPPAGEGFQLWETTSEGSPNSPVFKTLDELCEWCEEGATTFADFKATKEEWKKMLSDGFVQHTEGNVTFT